MKTKQEIQASLDRVKASINRADGILADTRLKARTIREDGTRTDSWKAQELQRLQAVSGPAMAALGREVDGELASVRPEFLRYRDPVMQLSGFKAKGAVDQVEDAAIKGEFRRLMQTVPAESRLAWLDRLAEEGDWGRLGVLVALDPRLSEEAKALPIPDQDETLSLLGEVRSLAASFPSYQQEHDAIFDRSKAIQAGLASAFRDLV